METKMLNNMKIEHIDYFNRHKDVIQIDYLYYLNLISNPIDQILNVIYCSRGDNLNVKDFVLGQYNYRFKIRQKLLDQISQYSKPHFIID